VLAVGALPEASDRIGRDDPEVAAMAKELGLTTDVFAKLPSRDYEGPGYIQHRKIGPRDLYAIYNAPKDTEVFFRATGKVELWDPWTGATRPLAVTSQTATGTKLKLPLTEKEIQLIVFSGTGFQPVTPATASLGQDAQATQIIALAGDWDFELAPSLDNRFGDFHWPPTKELIGPEARRLKYADETSLNPGWQAPTFDDSKWRTVTCGFGPRFWKLGPLSDGVAADEQLAALKEIDPAVPVEIGGKKYRWQPYEFSWRFGMEDDCAHQGYHGLKEQVADEFIGLGTIKHGHPSCTRQPEKDGTRYYLWTSVNAASAGQFSILRGGLLPSQSWLNGAPLETKARAASLKSGANPLLLRYDKIGRGYFVISSARAEESTAADHVVFSTAANWIWIPDEKEGRASRYFRRLIRLDALPTIARIRITCDNGYTLFVNGREIGHGSAWERVQEYDVKSVLKTGDNVVAVDARNDGGEAGFIAELAMRDSSRTETRIGTDIAWRCSHTKTDAWRDAAFDASSWPRAIVVSPFEGSLWAKHQNGPPKLDDVPVVASSEPEKKMPWNVDLAMRWYSDARVLPFDTRPQTAQPAGWYRFVAPPGLRVMTIPTKAEVRGWADGKELAVKSGSGVVTITIPQPEPAPVVVALRVEQHRGDYGGAAFSDYIKLDCGPGKLAPGDWSKTGVLETYSGGAWYRKTVTLSAEQAKSRATLDLGSVAASAEVRINGKPAGIKVAPPWALDITKLVAPGENRIEVLVCNTLANHYVTIPTHYRGQLTSGLLGPASIEVTK
jgi:hypothetical protein